MSILSKAFKQSLRAFARRGERRADERALERAAQRFPALGALREAAGRSSRLLAAPYEEYVGGVSAPEWAVSLQTAALLHALATLLEPRSVLDLGSGFSSYAFRLHARARGGECTVHSVDEDTRWLERTRAFLGRHGLAADGLALWSDFAERAAPRYDLVLHDIGRLPLRTAALPRALELAAADGIVVLDDVHTPEYTPLATACCASAGFEVCSARALTLDSFGRYAWLAFRAPAGSR